MAEARLIRWIFAGGKPQGLCVLRRAIERGWPPALIVWPPELPQADVSDLIDLAGSAGIQAVPSSSLEDRLQELVSADLLVTCRFGLLKPTVFEAPRLGAINVHSSLLPRYRGVHPVAWALIRGEETTGVSVHCIEATIDSGPILAQIEVPITRHDDIWSLTRKLDAASAEAVEEVLDLVHRTGRLPVARPQMGAASWAPRRRPEDGRIDWALPANGIHNLCRALRPPMPPPFAFIGQGIRVHAIDSRQPTGDWGAPTGKDSPVPVGTVEGVGDGNWYRIACAGGGIELRTDIPLLTGTRLS